MLARRRPEVFQKDIRRGDELAQNLPGLCLAQVERDAFLVSIKRAEARAVALVFGIAPAVGVAAVGQFDFNHFAAQVAEQAAGVGPGHMAADIDASETFESAGDHLLFANS